jgi:hypothetical protein
MKRSLHTTSRSMLIGCLMGFGPVSWAEPPTLDSIRQTSLERHDAIKNVWVEYDVDYQFFTDSPSVRSRYVQPPYSMTFALLGERRLAVTRPKEAARKLDQTFIFDGEYTLLKESASLVITPGKERTCENLEQYCLHALQMSYRDQDRVSLTSAWFFPECLRQGLRLGKSPYRVRPTAEEVDGHECWVLEYPDRDTIWIDLAIGGAIRQRERFNPDADGHVRRLETSQFSDYRQTPTGIWAPWHCELSRFGLGMDAPELKDQPVMKQIMDVSRLRINELNADDFGIKLLPGTKVFTTEGGFVVPGDDEELLTDFGRVLAKHGHGPKGWRWSWLVIVNLAGGALLAGIAIHRWRQRRGFSGLSEP